MNNTILECLKAAAGMKSLYDRTEDKLKSSIYKILLEHLDERERKVVSKELEMIDGHPAVRFEGGHVLIDPDLTVVEEYDEDHESTL